MNDLTDLRDLDFRAEFCWFILSSLSFFSFSFSFFLEFGSFLFSGIFSFFLLGRGEGGGKKEREKRREKSLTLFFSWIFRSLSFFSSFFFLALYKGK